MTEPPKSFEKLRGCGVRQVGKLYLVGEGIGYVCPGLPLLFKECEVCGFKPPQYRDFQWVNKAYIRHIKEPTGQMCDARCPVCYTSANDQERYGLMFVGRKYYTPVSFIEESENMEVSKAIKQIPKDLTLGTTWVMLAHPDAFIDRDDDDYREKYEHWVTRGIDDGDPEPKPPAYPGVFFAFIPQRVEMPIYESDTTPEYLTELEGKGITPVIIPDSYDAHKRVSRKVKTRRNVA